jgi:hypothetical protein
MTANCLQQLFAVSDWLLVPLEQEKMLECLVRHRPTMWSGDQSGKTKQPLYCSRRWENCVVPNEHFFNHLITVQNGQFFVFIL